MTSDQLRYTCLFRQKVRQLRNACFLRFAAVIHCRGMLFWSPRQQVPQFWKTAAKRRRLSVGQSSLAAGLSSVCPKFSLLLVCSYFILPRQAFLVTKAASAAVYWKVPNCSRPPPLVFPVVYGSNKFWRPAIFCRRPPKRNLQVWAAAQDDVTTGQRQHQAALKGKARKGTIKQLHIKQRTRNMRSGKVQQKRSSLAPGDDACGYCKQPPASVEEWYRGPFHLKEQPASVSREWKAPWQIMIPAKLASRSRYSQYQTLLTKELSCPDGNMRVSQAIKSGTKFALVQADSQVDLERLKKVWDCKAKAKNKVFVEHLSVNDLLGILPEGGKGGLSKAYRSKLGESTQAGQGWYQQKSLKITSNDTSAALAAYLQPVQDLKRLTLALQARKEETIADWTVVKRVTGVAEKDSTPTVLIHVEVQFFMVPPLAGYHNITVIS
eukprot:g44355.t1